MSRNSVSINPNLITWARERARLSVETLSKRFPKIQGWEEGQLQPTLRQLEDFATAVHVPIGYLFLPEPVKEQLPVSDFRTIADRELSRPSPNLLDTLYLCQERQTWYREYMQLHRLRFSPLCRQCKPFRFSHRHSKKNRNSARIYHCQQAILFQLDGGSTILRSNGGGDGRPCDGKFYRR
jgi:transcriptional regulator with XRE-family HTH domain